jgi:predicted RNase H-like HicB family nuclease
VDRPGGFATEAGGGSGVEGNLRTLVTTWECTIAGDAVLRYEVIISWSNDDDAFIAEMPELPGCAADGATLEEALENVQVVAREWIATAQELPCAVPEPRGRLMFA